ncbi:MAG: hypothetical protein ACI8V4_000206 [Ilumatobacter sp.]|jgi:hypothetical protein
MTNRALDQPTQQCHIAYLGLAHALHLRHTHLALDPPSIDRDTNNPWEDERTELLRIVEAVYGPLEDAFIKIMAERDQLQNQADAETRTAHGIEAHKLLLTLDKTTALSNRVALSIARDLKAYRDLKKLEADLCDTDDADAED